MHFEQPVELAAHEDQTVVFSPEQFPALRVHNPKLWWPRQMGEPHLERLTVSFNAEGTSPTSKASNFGIREITSELTANGSRLFRVNGKPILIRGAGWSQDMLLRTDDAALARPVPAGPRHEPEHHPPRRQTRDRGFLPSRRSSKESW